MTNTWGFWKQLNYTVEIKKKLRVGPQINNPGKCYKVLSFCIDPRHHRRFPKFFLLQEELFGYENGLLGICSTHNTCSIPK